MTNWQHIDSAPKDGTAILVWNAHPEYPEVMLVSWDKEQYHYPGSKARWTWCVPGSHQDEQGGCETADHATHWMPLPSPPVRESIDEM